MLERDVADPLWELLQSLDILFGKVVESEDPVTCRIGHVPEVVPEVGQGNTDLAFDTHRKSKPYFFAHTILGNFLKNFSGIFSEFSQDFSIPIMPSNKWVNHEKYLQRCKEKLAWAQDKVEDIWIEKMNARGEWMDYEEEGPGAFIPADVRERYKEVAAKLRRFIIIRNYWRKELRITQNAIRKYGKYRKIDTDKRR